MKKVLALVLAVVMVCTMAFAVTVENATIITSSSFNGDEVKLNGVKADKNGYYYIELGDNLFTGLANAVNATNVAISAKNYKVTLGATNAEFVFGVEKDSNAGHGYIRFKGEDKVLDGKADVVLSSLKIELIGYGTTYITMNAKDGVMEFGKCVVKGNTVYDGKQVTDAGTKMNATAETFKSSMKAEYDIGFEPTTISSGALTGGWYKIGAKGNYFVNPLFDGSEFAAVAALAKDATVKVTVYDNDENVWTDAKTDVDKLIKAAGKASDAGEYFGGVVATEKMTATIQAGDNVYLYTVNSNGTVSASPFTFADGKGWTMTGKDIPVTVVSPVKLATVATPAGTPGTTTNPGTGANDVVGVAAALAVVALVSGAAISLKK